jgi:Protein of unknown function (DUF5131)
MGAVTKIEWCHHTFNPWWGCTQVSPLCDHCYAMMLDAGWFKRAHWGPSAARRHFYDEYWAQPLEWERRSKRMAFAHEQELRAIWWSVNPDERDLVSKDQKLIDEGGGIAIPVDLNVLIDSVIVKPQSPQWLVELVKTVSAKFELEAPVLASDMSQDPPVPIP